MLLPSQWIEAGARQCKDCLQPCSNKANCFPVFLAVLWMILYLDLPLLRLKINSGPGLHLLRTSASQSCVTNKDIDLTTRPCPLHVRVVILLLLISAGAGPLPAAREFTLWHFLSVSSHTATALPCSIYFWQHSHLFWALEIWAVSYFCWKWSSHFCFPFSLLLLDALQHEKGDVSLTAWTTFRPQVPPLHFYTSISSTVKDP